MTLLKRLFRDLSEYANSRLKTKTTFSEEEFLSKLLDENKVSFKSGDIIIFPVADPPRDIVRLYDYISEHLPKDCILMVLPYTDKSQVYYPMVLTKETN